MSTYQIIDRLHLDSAAEREALIAGLLATPATIPPKYFYDELGCALFCAICELSEYYPTRTEVAIFSDHRQEIAQAAGTGKQLIDLGAGDCCKAASWLPYFQPRRYIAVDIARAPINKALSGLAPEFPEIEMLGIVTDFARALNLRGDLLDAPATFFYPGSSIGNFSPDDALAFLTQIRMHCTQPGSGLLIGVDAKKDRGVLEAAYDDAVGVTAAFNRNVLVHINRLLGSDFHPARYAHRGIYNEAEGRIEMHLEARSEQVVAIDSHRRRYFRGERIHTENSYKYAPEEFEALLRRAGFARNRLWQDAGRQFSVFYAE
ncbi:MAG: L-histidine N(alpha)-methyltransferase [Betaproteobacteria bacterium]